MKTSTRITNQKNDLIAKYNIPGPRYTSYPTVPYWENNMPRENWQALIRKNFKTLPKGEGLSLYIHLPFCESLCTYCGCNKRITVNHAVEEPYIDTVLKEWSMYLSEFGSAPLIKELHLGGGTPTFFSPKNLTKLIEGIFSGSRLAGDAELSIEGHPNNTTQQHLQTLYQLGFRRVSFGIQDFDPRVQEAINRFQTFQKVTEVTFCASSLGYTSINYDLIYGLPFQTLSSIKETIEKVKLLKPDRIAFYSYAHVPWVSPGQRKYSEADLPSNDEKRSLYEAGRFLLEEAGYIEIGMDHFALKTDSLYIAVENGDLNRNFMGYTTSHTKMLIGLGVSSISDVWNGFAQNIKVVEEYSRVVHSGELPIIKGHILTEEDLILRKHISNLMCKMKTEWSLAELQTEELTSSIKRLEEMEADGLIRLDNHSIQILETGKPFLRNVCMALDARLLRDKPATQIFSQTI